MVGKPVDNEYIFFGVEKAYQMAPFSKQVFKIHMLWASPK